MDKEQAIQELKQFRDEYIVSRDKILEIWNFFKFNTNEEYYTTLVNNAPVKIRRNLFWDIVNTSDIRKICQKPKVEDDTITPNEQSVTPSGETVDITEITKLRKELVSTKNKLSFERNTFNKNLKEISSLEELNKELIENLQKLQPILVFPPEVPKKVNKCGDILLIQLSDLHINEITNEFRNTNFNIKVASRRLQKFADKIKEEIETKQINKVVIAITGDICNSDSILSKQQNNVTNKAISILLATKLIEWFILDIYKSCQDINILSVSGNEGRLFNSQEFFTDENLVTNSPDFIIFNFLEMLFNYNDNIRFIHGRNTELVVDINGSNILFTHGVHLGKGDVGKSVQQTIARYADKGVNIRFVVFGHLHATKLSNYFMRSASLVGNNSYATTMLNLNSRASQNIAIIGRNGDITPIAIDLENIEEYNGYDIQKDLDKFNIQNVVTNEYNDTIEMIYGYKV